MKFNYILCSTNFEEYDRDYHIDHSGRIPPVMEYGSIEADHYNRAAIAVVEKHTDSDNSRIVTSVFLGKHDRVFVITSQGDTRDVDDRIDWIVSIFEPK